MTTISVEEAARRFDKLANSFLPELAKPFGDLMDDAVRDAEREFEAMTLFSKGDGPELLLESSDIRQVGGELEGEIQARGMAAIVEEGGQTQAHAIVPNSGSVLKLETPTGTFFARQVAHPGSEFQPHGFIEDAVEKADRRAGGVLDRNVQDTIRKVGLA